MYIVCMQLYTSQQSKVEWCQSLGSRYSPPDLDEGLQIRYQCSITYFIPTLPASTLTVVSSWYFNRNSFTTDAYRWLRKQSQQLLLSKQSRTKHQLLCPWSSHNLHKYGNTVASPGGFQGFLETSQLLAITYIIIQLLATLLTRSFRHQSWSLV